MSDAKSTILRPDICVIGAGAAGLSVAAGAAAFGVEVVLVEKALMGGECLNTGCVPSKALLSYAKNARQLAGGEPSLSAANFEAAYTRMTAAIAKIAPHDSRERFEGLGVTVLEGVARFVSKDAVEVNDRRIEARRFVIATGSQPLIPDIEGISDLPFFTNETLFSDGPQPDHLLILGAGAMGCEMAQAYRNLGAQVTLLDRGALLKRDEPENVSILKEYLQRDGIKILEHAVVSRFLSQANGFIAEVLVKGEPVNIQASHLLVASGRKANTEGLNLQMAGVDVGPAGITVDRGLRTGNRRVFAIGDVTAGPRLTHVAGHQAGLVLRSMLFRLPVRFIPETVPWVTYTSPQVGHVGLTLEEARKRYGDRCKVLSMSLARNDRAQIENSEVGQLKLYVGPGGKLLGGDMIGKNADGIIALLSLAVSKGLKMKDLAGFMVPYPSLSELVSRTAMTYYAELPENVWLRKGIGFLRRLG